MNVSMKRAWLAATALGSVAVVCPGLAFAAAAPAGPATVDELVVTANRREQNLQDVGAAVQVLAGDRLERQGVAQIADFVLQVPGVSFREQGNGATRIALRGISNVAAADSGAGSTVSTVGLYFGEVPIQGTSVLPDLATYDLARVEVLKGPQGTLYGEGAMGGAIRMIPRPVVLGAFEGNAEATASATKSGELGYLVRGAVNIPIAGDKAGVRLVGSYRDEGGYIDNVATGEKNVNTRDGYSVRATLRVQPTERLNIELLGLYNREDVDGFNQINSNLRDLQIDTIEDRYNRTKFGLLAGTLTYDLGPANLTLVSSTNRFQRDFADRFPSARATFAAYTPITAQQERFAVDQRTTAHEARLVSSGDHRFDWVVGAFYRDRQSRSYIDLDLLPNELASLNAALGRAGLAPFPTVQYVISLIDDGYKQSAVYGEGTYGLTDDLDLTVGVRYFEENVRFRSQSVSYSFLARINNTNTGTLKDSGLIPKFNLTWRATPDYTLYAQAAKGFRSGGVNFQAVRVGGQRTYESDGLWNYEVGVKSQLFDRRVTANLSAFYIDWSDIQSNYFVPDPILGTPVGLVNNSGKARITGFEAEISARVTEGLMIGGSVAVLDSKLKEAAKGSDVIAGQSLPNTPHFTAAAYAEYRQPLSDTLNGFARIDVQHTDDQRLRFVTRTFNGFPVEGYTLMNLRGGVETEAWSAQLFVNNLGDKRAQYGRGLSLLTSTANPELLTIARPRTIGVLVRTNF